MPTPRCAHPQVRRSISTSSRSRVTPADAWRRFRHSLRGGGVVAGGNTCFRPRRSAHLFSPRDGLHRQHAPPDLLRRRLHDDPRKSDRLPRGRVRSGRPQRRRGRARQLSPPLPHRKRCERARHGSLVYAFLRRARNGGAARVSHAPRSQRRRGPRRRSRFLVPHEHGRTGWSLRSSGDPAGATRSMGDLFGARGRPGRRCERRRRRGRSDRARGGRAHGRAGEPRCGGPRACAGRARHLLRHRRASRRARPERRRGSGRHGHPLGGAAGVGVAPRGGQHQTRRARPACGGGGQRRDVSDPR